MKLRRRQTFAALCATVFAVAGAVLAPASAAQAASGVGWSWSWKYTSTDHISIAGSVPGAQVTIEATDIDGERTLSPQLTDNDPNDQLCAGLAVLSHGELVLERMVTCDGNISRDTPSLRGDITIELFAGTPNGSLLGPFYRMTIRDFDDDPEMRVAGTGFNWRYTDATHFEFDMVMPGARIVGTGSGTNVRTAQFGIWWTGGFYDCVIGAIQGARPELRNSVGGCPFVPGYAQLIGMVGEIKISSFAVPHSLDGFIAVPIDGLIP